MKNVFFPNNSKDEYYCRFIYNDKNRYKLLVNALKTLGNFENKIELFCEDNILSDEVYVLDKNGYKFSFDATGIGLNLKEKYQLKKQLGNQYFTFDFLDKYNICLINEGYKIKNGYDLTIFECRPYQKCYSIKKENISFYILLPSNVYIHIKSLINKIEENKNMNFFDLYNIIKEFIDFKNIAFIIGINKNKEEVGKISIRNGELDSFYLNDKKEDEQINLKLNNGILEEKAIKTSEISVYSVDADLQRRVISARNFIDSFKPKR